LIEKWVRFVKTGMQVYRYVAGQVSFGWWVVEFCYVSIFCHRGNRGKF